ncbi:MAG: TlpA family protein disulfide reductase [Clostridiales bacterium]|nr:TlpA family protein disulfide reductase [Clostridiales bacterium]
MKSKRSLIKFSCAIFMAIILIGCEETDTVKQEEAQTVTTSSNSEIFESHETGLIFHIPKEYQEKGIKIEGPDIDEKGHDFIRINYYYKPIIDKLIDDMLALSPEERTKQAQQEFYENMYKHSKCLMDITLIKEEEYNSSIKDGKKHNELSYWNNAEKFGTNDGYVYLIAIPENDTDGMEAEEKAQYEECHDYMKTAKENIEFTEINELGKMPRQMPKFTAKDLKGNTVTENIFTEKDLTVVNIWGTFCNPCVEEMPELGEWAKIMPENAQLIGIISDIESENDNIHYDLAVKIMEKSKADFTQIIANKDFESVMSWVTGVPTTLFVDKSGKIIGKPIVGADVDGYKKFVEDYLDGK